MNPFIKLPTRRKFFLGFGLALLLLALVSLSAHRSHTHTRQKSLHAQQSSLGIAELQAQINLNRVQTLETILSRDPQDQQARIEQIGRRVKQIDLKLEDLKSSNPENLKLIEQLDSLRQTMNEYRQARAAILKLALAGKAEEARSLIFGEQEANFEEARMAAQTMASEQGQQAAAATLASERQTWRFVLLSITAALLGLAMAVFFTNSLTKQHEKITRAAEVITTGDLKGELLGNYGTNEEGKLAQAFDRMRDSLCAMAAVAKKIADGDLSSQLAPRSEQDLLGHAFAAMVNKLRTMTTEISATVGTLGTIIREISTSATQFAVSTEERSVVIGETRTTVEEVRQTADASQQTTKRVADAAQHTRQISQNGKLATEETAECMNRIRQQMDTIAESMVRLSEQTQAVGQIIATVDDLAQQSNLLAVNASIEAAKAGEQGKGFAVVASEVRNLAEQSRQATAHVRGILYDIQKATNAAVMATEQGSKAVEAGVTQSNQAGESILMLADSIDEAAQAAMQIAASSQQQLVGMEQVAQAMENITASTAANVSGAKQLETSTCQLNNLSDTLKALTEYFKI